MIRRILNIPRLVYRAWFFVVTGFFTLLWSPLALIASLSERFYPAMYWIARNLWALPVLYCTGCPPRVQGNRDFKKGIPYMLVANHTSYFDIMLMLSVSKKPFVFVGKIELAQIPVFGYLYRRASILVDRSSKASRAEVFDLVEKRIRKGMGICIFPEAGVPEDWHVLGPFKKGAFSIAKDHQITLVPMTFYDCRHRLNWNYFAGGPGPLRARVHAHIPPAEFQEWSWEELKTHCFHLIQNDYLEHKWTV